MVETLAFPSQRSCWTSTLPRDPFGVQAAVTGQPAVLPRAGARSLAHESGLVAQIPGNPA
jgi:hypothetical protein